MLVVTKILLSSCWVNASFPEAHEVLDIFNCDALDSRFKLLRMSQQNLSLNDRVFEISETPCTHGIPPRLKGCYVPPNTEFDILLNMGPR